MTNLDSILKSWDFTLPTKVCLVKAMVFPVVMYGCESWTVKKAERWKIDAFDLWCWRRFLRVPWTAWRSNQSILKEISPECSLEGLMLKLKLQYFGHLMRRVDSLEKTLMLGGIGVRRRRGQQRMRWLDGITDSWTWVWVNSGSLWWTGRPGVLQFIGLQRVGHDWVTELKCLSWTFWWMTHYAGAALSPETPYCPSPQSVAICSHGKLLKSLDALGDIFQELYPNVLNWPMKNESGVVTLVKYLLCRKYCCVYVHRFPCSDFEGKKIICVHSRRILTVKVSHCIANYSYKMLRRW